ncbi:rhombosortase [Glaciecola sp. MH2013]|uniref:rhombosortase n=1 Tax=Glaciecola sp. MH2013 TaxID=2785524 RepID=UPI00189CBC55|nr:rhombosortase [Glaciecola sp. MH2013]MBF7072766.1 rhombosortase [Glaciecola sp. MH2013]
MIMNLPTRPNQILGPLIVCIVSITAFFFEPLSSEYFALERSWLSSGHYYQILTGHFLHTNTTHLLFNLFGVVLLWLLHGDDYRAASYLAKFSLICLSLSLLLYFFSPDIEWYVGLSGAIHGVFAWGCIQDIENKMKTGWLLLLGLLIKVLSEQTYGAGTLMQELIEANVAVDSHMFGSILGIIVGICSVFLHRNKVSRTPASKI